MKFGKLPPLPENRDFSKWCPHDALEEGDYWFILEYLGSCSNCPDGQLKVPNKFMAQYLRDTDGDVHHVFQTIETVRCAGCGSILDYVSVLCQSRTEGINVTNEFMENTK